jgi:hypothetical protein
MPILGKARWVINPNYYTYLPIRVIENMALVRDNNVLAESVINVGHMFKNLGLVHIGCEKHPKLLNEIRREAQLMYEFVKRNHPYLLVEQDDEVLAVFPGHDVKEFETDLLNSLARGSSEDFLDAINDCIKVGRQWIEERGRLTDEEMEEGEGARKKRGKKREKEEQEDEDYDLEIGVGDRRIVYDKLEEMLPEIEGYLSKQADYIPDVKRMVDSINRGIIDVMKGEKRIYGDKSELLPTRSEPGPAGKRIGKGKWRERFANLAKDAKFAGIFNTNKGGILADIDPNDSTQIPILQEIATYIIEKCDEWAPYAQEARMEEHVSQAEVNKFAIEIKKAITEKGLDKYVAAVDDDDINENELVDLREAARMLNVPENRIQDLVTKGDLRPASPELSGLQPRAPGGEQGLVERTSGDLRFKRGDIRAFKTVNYITTSDAIEMASSRKPLPGIETPTTLFQLIKDKLSPQASIYLSKVFNRNALASIKSLYQRVKRHQLISVMESRNYGDAEQTVHLIRKQAMAELQFRINNNISIDDKKMENYAVTRLVAYEFQFPNDPKVEYYDPAPDEEVLLPNSLRPYINSVRRQINGIKEISDREKEQLGDRLREVKDAIYKADFSHVIDQVLRELSHFRTEIDATEKPAEKPKKRKIQPFRDVEKENITYVGDISDGDHVATAAMPPIEGKIYEVKIVRRNELKAQRSDLDDIHDMYARVAIDLANKVYSDEAKHAITNIILKKPEKIEFPPGSGEEIKIGLDDTSFDTLENDYTDPVTHEIKNFRGFKVNYLNLRGEPRSEIVYTIGEEDGIGVHSGEECAETWAQNYFSDIDNSRKVDVESTALTKSPIQVLMDVMERTKGFNLILAYRGTGSKNKYDYPGEFLWGIYVADQNGNIDQEVPIGLMRTESGEVEDDPEMPKKLYAFRSLRSAEIALMGAQLGHIPLSRNPKGKNASLSLGHGRKQVTYDTNKDVKIVITNYENPKSISKLDRITDIMPSSAVVNPDQYKKKIDPTDPYSALAFEDGDAYKRWLDQKLKPTGWTLEEIFDTMRPLLTAIADNVFYKHKLYLKQIELDDIRQEAQKMVYKALENDKRRNTWYDPITDRSLSGIDDDPKNPTLPNRDQLREWVRRKGRVLSQDDIKNAVETATWTEVTNAWQYKHSENSTKVSYFEGDGNSPPSIDKIEVVLSGGEALSDAEQEQISERANKIHDELKPVNGTMYYTKDILENGRPTWWISNDVKDVMPKIMRNVFYTTGKVEKIVDRMISGPPGARLEKRNPGFVRFILRWTSKELSNRYMAGPTRRITAHPAGGTWDEVLVSTPVQSYIMTVYNFVNPQDLVVYTTDGIRPPWQYKEEKIPEAQLPSIIEGIMDKKHMPDGDPGLHCIVAKRWVFANNFSYSEGIAGTQEYTDKMRQVNKNIRRILNMYASTLMDQTEEGGNQRLTLQGASKVSLEVQEGNFKNYLDKFIYLECIPVPKTFSLDAETQDGEGDERNTLIAGQKSLQVATPDTIAEIRDLVDMILNIPTLSDRQRRLLMIKFGLDDEQAKIGFFRDLVQVRDNYEFEWFDPEDTVPPGFKMPATKVVWTDPRSGISFRWNSGTNPKTEEHREIFRDKYEQISGVSKEVFENFKSGNLLNAADLDNKLDAYLVKELGEDDSIPNIKIMFNMLKRGMDPNYAYDEIMERLKKSSAARPSIIDIRRELQKKKLSNYWEDKTIGFGINLPESLDPQYHTEEVQGYVKDKLEKYSNDPEMELEAVHEALSDLRRDASNTGAEIRHDDVNKVLNNLAAQVVKRLVRVDTEEYKGDIEKKAKEIHNRLELRKVAVSETDSKKTGPVIDQAAVDRTTKAINSIKNQIRLNKDPNKEAWLETLLREQQERLKELKSDKNFYSSITGKYYATSDIDSIVKNLKYDARYVNYISKKYDIIFPEKQSKDAITRAVSDSAQGNKLLVGKSKEELIAIVDELFEAPIGPVSDPDNVQIQLQSHTSLDISPEVFDDLEAFGRALRMEAHYVIKHLTSGHFTAEQVSKVTPRLANVLVSRLASDDEKMVKSTISTIVQYGPDEAMKAALSEMISGHGEWNNNSTEEIFKLYQDTPVDDKNREWIKSYIGLRKFGRYSESEPEVPQVVAPPGGIMNVPSKPKHPIVAGPALATKMAKIQRKYANKEKGIDQSGIPATEAPFEQ